MNRTEALALANKVRTDRATWRRNAAMQMRADGRKVKCIAAKLESASPSCAATFEPHGGKHDA